MIIKSLSLTFRLSRCLKCSSTSTLEYKCCTRPCSTMSATPVNREKRGQLEPVRNLNLMDKIYRVPFKQSLISMMFFGQMDIRTLAYPDMFKDADELSAFLGQKDNIKDNFAHTLIECNDKRDMLSNLGFGDMHSFSATENCLIFEGIGASEYQSSSVTAIRDYIKKDPVLSLDYNLEVVRMILNNCLTLPTINESTNDNLKKRLSGCRRVAYCFTEKHSSLGVVTEYDWSAQAKRKDDNTWSVTGSKCYVLDDNYDEYIIFCRTTDYVQENIKYPEGYDIPPCVVAFSIPKERVQVETFEEGGIVYQTINFPDLLLVEEDHLLIPPSEDNNMMIHNKRSLGQLAVSSVILGRMKSAYNRVVHFLRHEASQGQRDDRVSQTALMNFARRVFSVESTVYLVSAMFDCFTGRDMKLEGMACKVLASKFAEDAVRMIPDIIGNSNVNTGDINDYLGLWDGFLEGHLYNQLIIGLSGIRLMGPHTNDHVHKSNLLPFYPGYLLTDLWNTYRSSKNKADKPLNLSNYVNSNFITYAEGLEFCIRRLKWMTRDFLTREGSNSVSKQMDIMRLGMIAVYLLETTAIISRASRSCGRVLENFDADHFMCQHSANESTGKMKDLLSDLEEGMNTDKCRVVISRRNMKYGGYFAFSPLDKVHY